MKSIKILYWVTTTLIFLFEGVLVAFTSQSDMAVEGIKHLGYPDYFGPHLTLFKVVGAVILIVPFFKGRIKEWAYAGFFFDFTWAAISHGIVDGWLHPEMIFVIIAFVVWGLSYFSYHRSMK